MREFKFLMVAWVVSSVPVPALAAVRPSNDTLDYGIAVGAISPSKQVEIGNTTYNVIGANYDEPALNPMQLVVSVYDDSIEGGQAVFNAGRGFDALKKVERSGDSILVTVEYNDPEHQNPDGSYLRRKRQYLLRYRADKGDLSVK